MARLFLRLSFTFRIFSFGFLAWRPVIIGRTYHGYENNWLRLLVKEYRSKRRNPDLEKDNVESEVVGLAVQTGKLSDFFSRY